MDINKYESAQVLLKKTDVQFSGYLEQKISYVIMSKWIKCFVVILDGKIYIYSNSASKKPNLVGVLAAFNAIEVLKNRKKDPFWIFVLKPINETIPEMKFAASSEKEMNLCIKTFRESIIFSVNMTQPVSNDSNDDSNETQSYVEKFTTIPEKTQLPPIPIETEIPPLLNKTSRSSTLQSNSTSASLFANSVSYDIVNDDTIEIDPSIEQIYDDNMDDVLFYGTREEAVKEFSFHQMQGSYLVRQDNDRQIFTVLCDNGITKYLLKNDPETNTVSISGQDKKFDDLSSLLTYYHEHNVPNHNTKLSIATSLLKSKK